MNRTAANKSFNQYLLLALFIIGLIISADAEANAQRDDGVVGSKPKTSAKTKKNKAKVNPAPKNNTKRSIINKITPAELPGLAGTWVGTLDNDPGRLEIDKVEGNTFSGVLSKTNKGVLVSVNGFIDVDTRKVTIAETKVIALGKVTAWYLGLNNGVISNDGKTMSGTGRDKARTYSWTFSKQ